MTAAKAADAKSSPWADVLRKGVEGWSSYSDTGDAGDRRTEEEGPFAESSRRAAGADSGAAGVSDRAPGGGDKPSLPPRGHLRPPLQGSLRRRRLRRGPRGRRQARR